MNLWPSASLVRGLAIGGQFLDHITDTSAHKSGHTPAIRRSSFFLCQRVGASDLYRSEMVFAFRGRTPRLIMAIPVGRARTAKNPTAVATGGGFLVSTSHNSTNDTIMTLGQDLAWIAPCQPTHTPLDDVPHLLSTTKPLKQQRFTLLPTSRSKRRRWPGPDRRTPPLPTLRPAPHLPRRPLIMPTLASPNTGPMNTIRRQVGKTPCAP